MRRLAPGVLTVTVLTVFTAAFLPGTARAGGFYISDIGTRAIARGGAFVASPDSLLAVHYNPAGLSLLSGFHFEADLSLVDLDFTFNRTCPCLDPSKVSNASELDAMLEASFRDHPAQTNSLHRIPYLAVGYGFPFQDLTVAFAGWGPNAGKYEYGLLPSASAPQFVQAARASVGRYVALDADTLEVNFALGAGLKIIDGLRFGADVIVYQNANDQHLDLWVNSATFATEPENPGFDVPILLHFKRDFALNWQLGLIWEPTENLSIGASFRGKRSVRADGTIDIELPDLLKSFNASVTGRNIELEVNTPPIARAGVQYEMPRVFRAEAAFVYEGWSTYERVVIRPKDIVFSLGTGDQKMSQPLAKILQPRGWKDTFSIRVGGELNLWEPYLGLRAGYFFEPTAIAPEKVDLSRVDLDKHGFALGLSTTWYGATFEFAVMYILLQTAEVKNSEVKIVGPLVPPLGSDQYATVVGNGTYEGSYVIGSASVSFALDPLLHRGEH